MKCLARHKLRRAGIWTWQGKEGRNAVWAKAKGVSAYERDGVRAAECGTLAAGVLPRLTLPLDVDECETEVCPGEHKQCENTEGSYRCVCAEGYKQMEGVCVKEQIPGEPCGGPQTPEEGRSSSRGRAGSPRPCPIPTATTPLPQKAALRPKPFT